MKQDDFWARFRKLQVLHKSRYLSFESHFEFKEVNCVRWIELDVPHDLPKSRFEAVEQEIESLQEKCDLSFDVDLGIHALFGDEPYEKVCKGTFLKRLNGILPVKEIEVTFLFKPKI